MPMDDTGNIIESPKLPCTMSVIQANFLGLQAKLGWSVGYHFPSKMQTSRLWNTAKRFMSNAARKNDHGNNSLNQQVLDEYMVPGPYLRYFKTTRRKKRSLEVPILAINGIESLTKYLHSLRQHQRHSIKSTKRVQGLCMKMIQLQRLLNSTLHNVFIVVLITCIHTNHFLDG